MTDWKNDPEYRALLENVLTNPEDNAPRWIISDWLEEHDQIRYAQIIRIQLEIHEILERLYSDWLDEQNVLDDPESTRESFERQRSFNMMDANQPISAEDARISELSRRFHELWKSYPAVEPIQRLNYFSKAKNAKVAWLATTSNAPDETTALVDRGFICEISMPCSQFMEHAASLFREHPITRAWLTDKHPCFNNDSLLSETYPVMWRIENPDAMNGPSSWVPPKIGLKLSSLLHYRDIPAIQALAIASVDYGRELVGLPPLNSL